MFFVFFLTGEELFWPSDGAFDAASNRSLESRIIKISYSLMNLRLNGLKVMVIFFPPDPRKYVVNIYVVHCRFSFILSSTCLAMKKNTIFFSLLAIKIRIRAWISVVTRVLE